MQTRRFDPVTIAFHWLTVGLFTVQIGSIAIVKYKLLPSVGSVLQIHRGSGAVLLGLVLLRLLWRWTFAYLPPFPESMSEAHRKIVRASEYSLYGALIGQALSGLGMSLSLGHSFTLIVWRIPALMPFDPDLEHLFQQMHEVCGYSLICFAAGHACAALFHHFVLGDDTLRAMQFRTETKAYPPRTLTQGAMNEGCNVNVAG